MGLTTTEEARNPDPVPTLGISVGLHRGQQYLYQIPHVSGQLPGNNEYTLDWEDSGRKVQGFTDGSGKLRSRPQNIDFFFKEGVNWTKMSNGPLCTRIFPAGFTFESNGPAIFPKNDDHSILEILALTNATTATHLLRLFSANIDYGEGDIRKIPVQFPKSTEVVSNARLLVGSSKRDWNAYERSWDFQSLSILTTFSEPTPTLECRLAP